MICQKSKHAKFWRGTSSCTTGSFSSSLDIQQHYILNIQICDLPLVTGETLCTQETKTFTKSSESLNRPWALSFSWPPFFPALCWSFRPWKRDVLNLLNNSEQDLLLLLKEVLFCRSLGWYACYSCCQSFYDIGESKHLCRYCCIYTSGDFMKPWEKQKVCIQQNRSASNKGITWEKKSK